MGGSGSTVARAAVVGDGTGDAEREVAERLGATVRRLRREQGLTLESLGRRTGLSKSFLSQLESGRTNPTLSTLTRLALALGATPTALLGTDCEPAAPSAAQGGHPLLTTRRPARSTQSWPTGSGRTYPLTGPGARRFETVLCDGTPNHHLRPVSHPGEEFCMVLAGALRIAVGDRGFLLHAGESLHFDSGIPHTVVAQTPTTRFLLTV